MERAERTRAESMEGLIAQPMILRLWRSSIPARYQSLRKYVL